MRKLLLALLLVASTAHADILATTQNRAGGLIYFTDTHCDGKGAYWKIVYSTLSGGQTIWGCWFYDSGMVHVSWNSGGTSAYDARTLTLKGN